MDNNVKLIQGKPKSLKLHKIFLGAGKFEGKYKLTLHRQKQDIRSYLKKRLDSIDIYSFCIFVKFRRINCCYFASLELTIQGDHELDNHVNMHQFFRNLITYALFLDMICL